MYDADYEEFMQEQNDRAIGAAVREGTFRRYNPSEGKYETKDSGKRFESPDGMVRDTSEGKPQFSLMFPKDIPFEDQLMTRVADLYHRGGVKYGERNWEKSSTEKSLAKHEDCLMRHVVKFLLGMEDEDHAAAVVWNVNAVLLTRYKIALAEAEAAWPDSDLMKARISKSVKQLEKTDAEFIAKTNAAVSEKPFPKVEFKLGDELLDKNNDRWSYYGESLWDRTDSNGTWWCRTAKELAAGYGPIMFQDGAYAGITMLKDGSLRWG